MCFQTIFQNIPNFTHKLTKIWPDAYRGILLSYYILLSMHEIAAL